MPVRRKAGSSKRGRDRNLGKKKAVAAGPGGPCGKCGARGTVERGKNRAATQGGEWRHPSREEMKKNSPQKEERKERK